MKKNSIKVFDCKNCIYGIYNHLDSCYEDGCNAINEVDCIKIRRAKNEKVSRMCSSN